MTLQPNTTNQLCSKRRFAEAYDLLASVDDETAASQIEHVGHDEHSVLSHVIFYHAKDAHDNHECSTLTRSVLVRDTLPPVITLHLKGKVVAKSASASHNAAGTAAGNPFIRFPRFMEQAINNGWVMAAAASAVMGVALLATSSKTDVSVPV